MRISFLRFLGFAAVAYLAFASTAFAQSHAGHMPVSTIDWFAVLELPFLFMAIFFAFRTASALKGGVFGQGMKFLAWGFTVMGVGHLNMQMAKLFNFDLITTVFGSFLGAFVWVIALVLTWGLSWYGFQSIYRAGSGSKHADIETVTAES